MRLDELFRNLGHIAGTIGAQMRESCEGVALEELDLTGAPPRQVALCGPAQVVLSEGEIFRIDVASAPGGDEVRFMLGEERLRIAGGDRDTVVRVTLPAPGKLSVAGSGRKIGRASCRERV